MSAGMRHLSSSSRVAAPQAARSYYQGTPLAGPLLLRPICTPPRSVSGGCSTALARRHYYPLAEGKTQLGAPLPDQRRPRTQRPRLRMIACAILAPHGAAEASFACPACRTPCPGPLGRNRTHPPPGGKSSTAAAARHTAASMRGMCTASASRGIVRLKWAVLVCSEARSSKNWACT